MDGGEGQRVGCDGSEKGRAITINGGGLEERVEDVEEGVVASGMEVSLLVIFKPSAEELTPLSTPRRELEYMLHIQRKAEIQVLLTRSSNNSNNSQNSQSQPSQRSSISSSSSNNNGAPSKLIEYVVHKLMEVLKVE